MESLDCTRAVWLKPKTYLLEKHADTGSGLEVETVQQVKLSTKGLSKRLNTLNFDGTVEFE